MIFVGLEIFATYILTFALITSAFSLCVVLTHYKMENSSSRFSIENDTVTIDIDKEAVMTEYTYTYRDMNLRGFRFFVLCCLVTLMFMVLLMHEDVMHGSLKLVNDALIDFSSKII